MRSQSGARVAGGTMLLIVVLAGLVGCASSDHETTPALPRATTEGGSAPAPSDSQSETATPREPRPSRYQPYRFEIDGAAKRTAARAVEALPEVRQVTYTQYFGYAPPVASILVEADFEKGRGTTYDVRIRETPEGWRTESISAAKPARPLEDPGPLVRRVLDHDRIVLPWAGRADVAAGLVSDTVLRSMLAVAQRHRIGVSVLVSAHPVQVFGTDRRSHHPDGLAYDIGSVDGRLVVERGAAELVRRVMRLAADIGAYQVGGPVELDGGQYFSDPTHSDHVHVGFTG